MLDDLKKIAHVDTSDMLGVAEKQLSQVEWDFHVTWGYAQPVKNIVFVALGGSAHAAELYLSWPGAVVPFEIVRDYNAPRYINQNTLCIVASFSGNTEESLSVLEQAKKQGAMIAVITAGGALEEIARENEYPVALLDSSIRQSRISWVQSFKALLTILETAELEQGKVAEFVEVCKQQGSIVTDWLPEVATAKNQAKQIAQELMGRSIVVYSGRKVYPIADKWKINFNEAAKNVAWRNFFPEQNHNEFTGWSGQPHDKQYALVTLQSEFEHPRIAERFELQDKILSGRRPHPVTVTLIGDSLLAELVYGAVLGDFVSLYLAVLNNVDPTPVPLVDTLKTQLS